MKKYKLEIEAVHTEDQRIYRSKGHWDSEVFNQTLVEYGVYPATYVWEK